MEEEIAHWGQARVVREENHGAYHLIVLRMPSNLEHSERGAARCTIERQTKMTGMMWLRFTPSGRLVDGTLIKTLDEQFLFSEQPLAPDADWPELLAFTKKVLDYDFQYPPELKVEYKFTDLTRKLQELKKRKPDR